MEDNLSKSSHSEEDALEKFLKGLGEKLARYKKLILLSAFMGGAFGIVMTYFVTKQYSTSVQILPEFTSSSGNSSFSSLASLAGIDLSQSAKTDAFRPDLYPTVLTSTTAVIHLLRHEVVSSDKKNHVTLAQYLSSLSEEKLPQGELQSSISNPDVWRFTKEEKRMIDNVKGRVDANFDKKSGIVVLNVSMPDPEISAASVVILTKYLKDFLAEYRIQKKRDQNKFLESRVKEALNSLNSAEFALQNYRDRNRNVVVNVARIQEQKLQSEFIQRQNVYNELIKQSEKSKIDVQQEEKILITVESPIVPLKASSPRKLYYGFGGAILAVLFLLVFLSKPWKLLI